MDATNVKLNLAACVAAECPRALLAVVGVCVCVLNCMDCFCRAGMGRTGRKAETSSRCIKLRLCPSPWVHSWCQSNTHTSVNKRTNGWQSTVSLVSPLAVPQNPEARNKCPKAPDPRRHPSSAKRRSRTGHDKHGPVIGSFSTAPKPELYTGWNNDKAGGM